MHATITSRLILTVALAAACAIAAPADIHGQGDRRERTLFVSALDEKGEPVEGLALGDFIVTEDGRRREVLRVSKAIEPIDIAVLFDNSTASEGIIVPLREAIGNFVLKMAGQNQIALVALASRPTIFVDYTSSQQLLANGVGRIFTQSNSGMTLLDAIVEVSNGLATREATRAVLVPIITDGVEFTSRYSRDVIAAMTRASVGLHAFTISILPTITDIDRERSAVLDLGTRATGGQHVALLTELGLDQAMQRLARELSSQYKVVYSRPESFLPPEKIEVASERTGVTMRGTPARGQSGA